MAAIAGKAVALDLAATTGFRTVMARVADLARILAGTLNKCFELVSAGTDSHLVLVDLRNRGITGKMAEVVLEAGGILANRNLVPGDTAAVNVTSGLRLGTNVAAYRGLSDDAFGECCDLLAGLLEDAADTAAPGAPTPAVARVRAHIAEIMAAYPIGDAEARQWEPAR